MAKGTTVSRRFVDDVYTVSLALPLILIVVVVVAMTVPFWWCPNESMK